EVSEKTAALMLTNPNTLGTFERQIGEIARIVHDAGTLLYLDGANLNALVGLARPGEMGFDFAHINLHKTFSTPHGGGGPGGGVLRLREAYTPSYEGYCMHQFVLSASKQKARGVRALDIAKRILDFGMHAPTTYFPLIVDEALMVEPTETETKAGLDAYADVLLTIDRESRENPERVKEAPTQTPVR